MTDNVFNQSVFYQSSSMTPSITVIQDNNSAWSQPFFL